MRAALVENKGLGLRPSHFARHGDAEGELTFARIPLRNLRTAKPG